MLVINTYLQAILLNKYFLHCIIKVEKRPHPPTAPSPKREGKRMTSVLPQK